MKVTLGIETWSLSKLDMELRTKWKSNTLSPSSLGMLQSRDPTHFSLFFPCFLFLLLLLFKKDCETSVKQALTAILMDIIGELRKTYSFWKLLLSITTAPCPCDAFHLDSISSQFTGAA